MIFLFRSAAVLFAFAVVTISIPAAGADIGVPNPGFERLGADGSLVGWRLAAERSTGSARVIPLTDGVHAGVGAVGLEVGDEGRATVESDPVELQVGKLYRLSGWIRTIGAVSDPMTKYPTAVPACLTMASFPFTNHSQAVGGDADWTRVETLFIATQASDRVRLHLGYNGTARGVALFDDIRVEPTDDITEYIPMETVRWSGPGFRYDDKGWIFVHIEGEPYERGHQYGSLVADEIAEYIRKLGVLANGDDPEAGWDGLRFEADAIFLRQYDEEYLIEMKGIADGAAAEEVEAWGRAIDFRDIVTVNSVIDLGQLHRALDVTPNSLTGQAFLAPEDEISIDLEQHKCSAFVATGPATAGGQVVFGQIFMWGGFAGVHWNVICDIEPSEGHRLVYQTFPGGIHSGADFYMNSAGIVFGETTVMQTPYEADSTPQSNRARKAAQYASSIDDVERILWEKNNGMYTNDWPIADMKTGEVAILLLGTHTKKMWRTGEDMGPFGTPGFLWANNNARDPEVRKEYVAQPDDRPFDLMFSPWNRDIAFNQFYQANKGEIDAEKAIGLWASSPVNRAHACDGKITTSEMAQEMVFLAHHGKVTLREKFPTKGWRILPDLPGAEPHLSTGYSVVSPIFVANRLKALRPAGDDEAEEDETEMNLDAVEGDFDIDGDDLWRGTVWPATEAESWFISATAAYWRLLDGLEDDPEEAAVALADELAALENRFLYTVSREGDMPALDAHRAYDQYSPYLLPRIKGTFALHQLRLLLGKEPFLDVMRTVHQRFDGRTMTTADFIQVAEEISGKSLETFVRQWLDRKGLPEPQVEASLVEKRKGGWDVTIRISQAEPAYHFVARLGFEIEGRREIREIEVEGNFKETFHFEDRPERVEFDVFHDLPTEHDSFYVWRNFIDQFHDTLIVYGTARQIEANHTMARRWQERVADAYIEILPPLIKDAELTPETAATHDLMVLGTLNDNSLFAAIPETAGVRWGRNSFGWKGENYADPDDGLFLALPNPFNPERVMYVLAANSAKQLWHMTEKYRRGLPQWAVFKGDEVVDSGYFERPGFVVEFGDPEG